VSLTAYRRHLTDCPHLAKGQKYTLCDCPIWCYGTVHGQRIRRSLGTTDVAKALRRIDDIERGQDDRQTSPLTPEAIRLYLESCKARNLRASSIESYTNTLGHLGKAFATHPVDTIDALALDRYQQGRGIAASTWRKELETLRAFLAWCIERGWCQINPARKLRMPRTEELTTQPFEPAQITKLIAACDQIFSDDPSETEYIRQRARALVLTLLYSGLRISDIAALERSRLDDTDHLTLKVLKNGVRLKVLLHPSAVKALTSLPARNVRYFFWTGRGDIRTCIGNLRRTVQRLGQLADIHAHPHRFRDTFAVELLTNGADIRTVQKLLGHTSVRTTEKHYAHFVAAHQALLDSATATLDFERNRSGLLVMHAGRNRRRNP
jgi:site-specific recombinase XerD